MDNRDFGIERPQVVWLTLGAIVLLGMMFAAGYVVGRRAERIEPVQVASADPLARIESDREMHEKLTFYEKLRDASPPSSASPARPEAKPQPPAPPLAAEPAAPSAPVATPPVIAAPKPAPVLAPARQGPSDDVRRALNAGPASSGDFTVQVSAFQSLPEAQAFSAGLERKGYRPFVVSTSIAGRGTWYRVRLGRFDDEATAKAAKTLLASSDIPAWILRME
jgi:cell division protein FtsN